MISNSTRGIADSNLPDRGSSSRPRPECKTSQPWYSEEHANRQKYPRTGCKRCGDAVWIADTEVRKSRLCGEPDNFWLCTTCDDLTKTVCDGCRRILLVDEIQIVDDFAKYRDGRIRLCLDCNNKVTRDCRCRACGAPAAYQPSTGPTALPGSKTIRQVGGTAVIGRRCRVCGTGSLESKAGAQQYYDAVVEWMTGWAQDNGETYPDYGERLEWDIARDATFTTEAGGQTLGDCETETEDGAPNTYDIKVLNFIRPIAFQRTLVHELTHALTQELGIAGHPKIEGFCNYVAYCYMRHLESSAASASDRAEATEHIGRLESNLNQKYGVDFRAIRDELKGKEKGAIAWLRGAQ